MSPTSYAQNASIRLSASLGFALLLLPISDVAQAAKTPAVRLKHVNQSLESVAGRLRSTRTLTATGELATGLVFAYTGIGMLVGTAKYMNQPGLESSGNFSVDLGDAFIDAYSRVPGAILGITVGGVLTYTGFKLGLEGFDELKNPSPAERYYFDTFQKVPQTTPAQIEAKAALGEKTLMDYAHQARSGRLFYGWTTLACGTLMLIAATAHPEQPAGFFLGGGAGVYGFVSLLAASQTEEEYEDYQAWLTDQPRDIVQQGSGWKLAALPTPKSLALGLSFGF